MSWLEDYIQVMFYSGQEPKPPAMLPLLPAGIKIIRCPHIPEGRAYMMAGKFKDAFKCELCEAQKVNPAEGEDWRWIEG